jgi:hypothetical protein
LATFTLEAVLKRCREQHGLAIEGLMCIPPADENPGPHSALLAKLAREAGVDKLSMGMSGDYELAVAFGATSVRVARFSAAVRRLLAASRFRCAWRPRLRDPTLCIAQTAGASHALQPARQHRPFRF